MRRMTGALTRMFNRAMSAAFEQWQSTAAQMADQQRKLKGAAMRMINRAMSAAFEQWQSTAAQMADEQRKMKGAAMRMINRAMSAAFEQWQSTAAQMADEQRKLGGALTRMLLRALSAAYNTWLETAKNLARQEVLIKRSCFLIPRALLTGCVDTRSCMRMIQAKLACFFSGWREAVATHNQQMRRMATAIGHTHLSNSAVSIPPWSVQLVNGLTACLQGV